MATSSFEEVPVEEVRDYWDKRPCNIRHSPRPVGSRPYFDDVEARKYRVEPHIPAFAEFEAWNGARVLEIGCGIGTDTINFARNGAQVTAVDLSGESLKVARDRVAVFGLEPYIDFYQGSAEDLLSFLPTEEYDLIYSFGVLHHTPHPRKAFQQLACYANKWTTLKLMVYNKVSAKTLGLTKGRFWRDDLVAIQSEAQTGCPVTYTYTPKSITKALTPWWSVYMTEVDHIFPYKIDAYKDYTYERHWWAKLPGFARAEKVLGWHLMVEAILS
jgi:SAM-dependent methyltransferase